MVTLDVKFTCEVCGTWIISQIRIGPHFFLQSGQMPAGWVVAPEEYEMRCWCPQHAMDKK